MAVADVTRLPTKFGQGHTDAIAFFQDELLPSLIENKIMCLAVRGYREDGEELHFTMTDVSGLREHNTRLLGLITELQAELVCDLSATPRKS
jgi:hypothetical protein